MKPAPKLGDIMQWDYDTNLIVVVVGLHDDNYLFKGIVVRGSVDGMKKCGDYARNFFCHKFTKISINQYQEITKMVEEYCEKIIQK